MYFKVENSNTPNSYILWKLEVSESHLVVIFLGSYISYIFFLLHATVDYEEYRPKLVYSHRRNSVLTIASGSSISCWTFTQVHRVEDQTTATIITWVGIAWIV